MAEKYDVDELTADLGELLAAAIGYRADVYAPGDRISERLGLGEDDSAEVIAGKLGKALGIPAARKCECLVDGPGTVLPLACPVHGAPCEYCGGLEGCTEDCDGETVDPVTGVPVIGTMTDSAGDEVRFGAFIGGVVIGCGNSPVILGEAAKEEEFAQLYVAACNRAAAARAVTPGQVPSAPGTYYACCIHCEHNGESDPDLDDERHPNPCREGCRAVTAGQVTP